MTKLRATSSLNRNIGARIAEVRRNRRLTQAALAGLLGISLKQLKRYELGESTISNDRLNEIAQWLECDTLRLLDKPGSHLPRRRERIVPVDYMTELLKVCGENPYETGAIPCSSSMSGSTQEPTTKD